VPSPCLTLQGSTSTWDRTRGSLVLSIAAGEVMLKGIEHVVTLLVRNPRHTQPSAKPFVEAQTSIPDEADPAKMLPVRSSGSIQSCPSIPAVDGDSVSAQAVAAATTVSCSLVGAQYMEVGAGHI
jgi:hypothetical protein